MSNKVNVAQSEYIAQGDESQTFPTIVHGIVEAAHLYQGKLLLCLVTFIRAN